MSTRTDVHRPSAITPTDYEGDCGGRMINLATLKAGDGMTWEDSLRRDGDHDDEREWAELEAQARAVEAERRRRNSTGRPMLFDGVGSDNARPHPKGYRPDLALGRYTLGGFTCPATAGELTRPKAADRRVWAARPIACQPCNPSHTEEKSWDRLDDRSWPTPEAEPRARVLAKLGTLNVYSLEASFGHTEVT